MAASSSVQHRCTSGRRSFGWLADCSMRFALLPLSPSLPSQLKSQLRRNTRERERGGGGTVVRGVCNIFPSGFFPFLFAQQHFCCLLHLQVQYSKSCFCSHFPLHMRAGGEWHNNAKNLGKGTKWKRAFFFGRSNKNNDSGLSLSRLWEKLRCCP